MELTELQLSELKKIEIEIFKSFISVCEKLNLRYYLLGGTLLGAVRHKGFIPWDDDIDVGMLREDYEEFLRVAPKELDKEKYTVQCFETHPEYTVTVPAMKIRLNGTWCQEYNTLLRNRCKDSDGIFIDVFIVDYVSETKWKDFVWRCRNGVLMVLITLLENIGMNPLLLKKRFVRNAKKYGEINQNSPLIGYDITWCFNSFIHPVVYPKESVFPIQYVKFEDTLLPIPKRPKDMLDIEISPKHMSYPPEADQKPKHIKDIQL